MRPIKTDGIFLKNNLTDLNVSILGILFPIIGCCSNSCNFSVTILATRGINNHTIKIMLDKIWLKPNKYKIIPIRGAIVTNVR